MLDFLSFSHGSKIHGGTINIAKHTFWELPPQGSLLGAYRHTSPLLITKWAERRPEDLWSQNKLLQAELFPLSTSMICSFLGETFWPSHELEHEPDQPLRAASVPSLLRVSGTTNLPALGLPLGTVWAYPAMLQAGGDIHTHDERWDMPCFSLFPLPGCPSWWGAVEMSLTCHLLPSYLVVEQLLPPASLSITIRGFLQRNCCQSPFHHPSSSIDNVWLITYPTHLFCF